MNPAPSTLIDYFVALATESRRLMDRLPIPHDIQPLAVIMSTLHPALEREKQNVISHFSRLNRPPPQRSDGPPPMPPGMNTVGILADRLTILLVKEWCLRHKERKVDAANALFNQQTMEIITVLAGTTPGIATLLEKVSSHDTGATAGSWEDAYFGLLSANILMWETQEMLYKRNMDSVPAEEVRDYIRFFSQANMQRNAHIRDCEKLYWRR